MRELHFAGNKLREIPKDFLRKLEKLEKLDLANNRLNRFPKINLKTLKHLNLNRNYIERSEDLELEALKELKILDIAKNQMKEGEIDKMRKKLSVNTFVSL